MKKNERSILIGSVLLDLLSIVVLPHCSFGDLLKGFEAQKHGDYETAITEFKSSANAGDEKAILFLGNSYQNLLRETYKRRGDSKTVAQSAIAALEPFALKGNRDWGIGVRL